MSSSSGNDPASWGTIFMGPNSLHETSLSRVQNMRGGTAWNEDTEREYMERVRVRAKDMAREILEKASFEAQTLRETARKEGYEAGMEAASAEIAEFRENMGGAVSAVLSAIESQKETAAAAFREELALLMRLCVEKIVAHELSDDRMTLMRALFDDAVAHMGESLRYAVRVAPEDEPLVADIVASGAGAAKAFSVRADASLTPGSLILETDSGMVDNSLAARRALVDNALAALVVPAPDAQSGMPGASGTIPAPPIPS